MLFFSKSWNLFLFILKPFNNLVNLTRSGKCNKTNHKPLWKLETLEYMEIYKNSLVLLTWCSTFYKLLHFSNPLGGFQ